ncbi:MAG TPA: NACHT domain-containing protein [Streptosporangiaceae bacterium]|nr:NACHT domain-containing protein [Streptosporangiaceae bacterium]
MSTSGGQLRTRARPRHEPGPERAWLRIAWHHAGAPVRWLGAQALHFRAQAGGEHAGRWGGRTAWGWFVFVAAWVGVIFLGFRLFTEFVPNIGSIQLAPPVNSWYHPGYDIVTGILVPFALAGMGYLFFLLWRMTTFRRPYKKAAVDKPEEMVQTSGTILGDVVGRDDLCRAIMEDLREPKARRPRIIVGDVGAGKTATLVRLTSLLAQKRAIPVTLRLRDCDEKLDFREAAYRGFCQRAETFRVSSAEADRVWQQLSRDNKLVVLADGLEEALQKVSAQENERDNLIRTAIHKARQESLPLVVASRPYEPLRGMEATITELEPLSERDALQYLRQAGSHDEDGRLRWIAETAAVSDSPLYLQITNDLNENGQLDLVGSEPDRRQPAAACPDKLELRMRLLEAWVESVIDGHLNGDISLDRRARTATVEQLSALACVGLMKNSLVVRFSDFPGPRSGTGTGVTEPAAGEGNADWCYEKIREQLMKSLDQHNWRFDLQLAAAYGQRLGLVEPYGDGLRYPHSILQAYLGSRYLGAVLAARGHDGTGCVGEALREPGREFLLALVMCARRCRGHGAARKKVAHIVKSMNSAARERSTCARGKVTKVDVATMDLYASAVQIIPETRRGQFTETVTAVSKLISEMQHNQEKAKGDLATLEKTRLRFVFRLGEAMRRAARQFLGGHTCQPVSAPGRSLPAKAKDGPRKVTGWAGDVRRRGTIRLGMAGDSARSWRTDLEHAYRQLFDLGVCDGSYAVRLAAAQEIGSGGDLAFEALRGRLGPLSPADLERMRRRLDSGDRAEQEQVLRDQVMRAWLAPMLAGSVTWVPENKESELTPDDRGKRNLSWQAQHNLESWISHVTDPSGADPVPYNLKIALAQGFKFVANWRQRSPYAGPPESRLYLAGQAESMLHQVGFWYSRLALLQALTLWSLPDGDDRSGPAGSASRAPDALMRQWLAMSDDEAVRAGKDRQVEHPFVAAGAQMCVYALVTGQPERFLWIDETGVTSQTGAGPTTSGHRCPRQVWIPASAGWSALDHRAQQLAADLLVYLNLAEGGERPPGREHRLARTDKAILPSCLTGSRAPLQPVQTAGAAGTRVTGAISGCAPDCPFNLCPYPPKGSLQHRAELSESLCRRERIILRGRGRVRSLRIRLTAPWQGDTKKHLKHFWEEMAERVRR